MSIVLSCKMGYNYRYKWSYNTHKWLYKFGTSDFFTPKSVELYEPLPINGFPFGVHPLSYGTKAHQFTSVLHLRPGMSLWNGPYCCNHSMLHTMMQPVMLRSLGGRKTYHNAYYQLLYKVKFIFQKFTAPNFRIPAHWLPKQWENTQELCRIHILSFSSLPLDSQECKLSSRFLRLSCSNET